MRAQPEQHSASDMTAMQRISALHSLSHRAHAQGWRRLARLLDGAIRLVFGAAIPAEARIAPDVFFHHSGLGVVINGRSIIEPGCEIGTHVVLGGRSPLAGAPILERNVIVHAGAKIVGPVRIGANSVIACNAVVLSDVPPGTLVAGMPAVVKKSGIDISAYRHVAEG